MANKVKSVFVCTECGETYDKWYGKCKECGSWNTLQEEIRNEPSKKAMPSVTDFSDYSPAYPLSMINENTESGERYQTGISELDRSLGGGIVKSSVILISGEPGIGKSTLLLQICKAMPHLKVLYVSGEESSLQIKMRARRLKAETDNLYLQCETDIDAILCETVKINPELLIIDSVQTLQDKAVSSSPGSISQVKQTSSKLISLTKKSGFSTILVGHVNKDGAIAGPKLLEHMVDVVLYFEGERSQSCRILRAVKNRYGSTNEIGLFEMTDTGLEEIPDPSKRMLEDSPKNVPGNCPVCLIEGTRPIISEVQALITKSPFPTPKRLSNGVDYNRMSMLLAVLEKRLGINFYDKDVYLNVVGGLRFDETASDLAVCVAVLSGIKDINLSGFMLAIGEVGLSGECRAVGDIDVRINEAARLGFEKILLPKRSFDRLKSKPENVKLVPIRSLFDLIEAIKD